MVAADVGEVSVPVTLQAAIAARIDRLDPKAKRTLSAAAVIGSRFSLNLLKTLGIDPLLEDLVGAEFVDQVSVTRGPEYVFHHPLIRTVAYESQLKSDRAELERVVKLAAGSATQTVLPFSGLKIPQGVAVDSVGTVYVADYENNRVVKLLAGSSTQSALGRESFLWLPPWTKWLNGLTGPYGVAVDSADNLYVTEHRRQSGAETARGVMRRTTGGCRVSPTEHRETPYTAQASEHGGQ
jgi:DNA-binding beta-propeller fold protein YncE